MNLPKFSKIFSQLLNTFLEELGDRVTFFHLQWKQGSYLFTSIVFGI